MFGPLLCVHMPPGNGKQESSALLQEDPSLLFCLWHKLFWLSPTADHHICHFLPILFKVPIKQSVTPSCNSKPHQCLIKLFFGFIHGCLTTVAILIEAANAFCCKQWQMARICSFLSCLIALDACCIKLRL